MIGLAIACLVLGLTRDAGWLRYSLFAGAGAAFLLAVATHDLADFGVHWTNFADY